MLLAVERHRDARLEADDDFTGPRREPCRVDRELEGLSRRRRPGILQLTALDGPAPQVLVDGVGVLLGERQVDAPRCQVVQQLRPGHVPLAGRARAP